MQDEQGPGEEEMGEDEALEAEELKRGSLPAPVLPTAAEIEAHNMTHLPFISWCSACVRGCGLSMGHCKVDRSHKEDEQIPTVSIDYGFSGQPQDPAHQTLFQF